LFAALPLAVIPSATHFLFSGMQKWLESFFQSTVFGKPMVPVYSQDVDIHIEKQVFILR
jgi:hypothetical protein